MKLKLFFVAMLAFNCFFANAVRYNGYGQITNCSGTVQPKLTSFFGVEIGATSFNVSKAILEERYGAANYVGQHGASWILKFNRVFWYDQPVEAWFYFKNSNNKYILDHILICCDEATVLYIAKCLNKAYGKGNCEVGIGEWGVNYNGTREAIEIDYYGYPTSTYRGFYIH